MSVYFRSVFHASNILLLSLVVMIFFIPFLPVSFQFHAYNISFSVILITSAVALQSEKRKIIITAAISLIILEWVAIQLNHTLLTMLSRIPQVLFFIFIVLGLIRQIATSKKVTERVIVDSISGYLLLGLVYGIIEFAIFRLNPDVFHFPEGSIDTGRLIDKMGDIMYYTFVTYTTTGYGDILPASSAVKALSTLISVSGQLYIAIIIALLVGKFASGIKD